MSKSIIGLLLRRGWRSSRPGKAPEAGIAGYRLISAAGVVVNDEDLEAACSYADERGLDVVDLIPARLNMMRATELLLMLVPRVFGTSRLARGATAGHALVVSEKVCRQAGVVKSVGLTCAEMDELAVRLKRYARSSTDFLVIFEP